MLSKLLSLDKLSCPQIWNIEKKKDKEKEKVGDSPEKLNEKAWENERQRARARNKKTKEAFLLEEQHENFAAAGEKMRNASGHQGENER